jgi:hypothetical protein
VQYYKLKEKIVKLAETAPNRNSKFSAWLNAQSSFNRLSKSHTHSSGIYKIIFLYAMLVIVTTLPCQNLFGQEI